MIKLVKTLTLSLALTAALTACQSQTSEVTTTGQPDGADVVPNPTVPADTTFMDPAAANATNGDNNMIAPSPEAAAANGTEQMSTGTTDPSMSNGK